MDGRNHKDAHIADKAPDAIALETCTELVIHTVIEEELFYPAPKEPSCLERS